MDGLPPDVPTWGPRYRQALSEYYTHSVRFMSHLTSLPVSGNTVTLDPAHPDRFGRPGLCLTHQDHPDDLNFFICDGSSFVTSGRGQPTMTIQALAFRAAEHIVRFARSHAA